ncbi:MAG TPA: hypothetical protein DHV65_05070, partial [Ktedonobacter sp.]|nr:hypothetical protein [Ktedonobacter sp.]
AVDSAGTVWFDDSLSSRIGSYVPTTGTFTMTVIEGGTDSNAHPHDGLAVDASNTIWFTEEFADKLGEVIQNNVPTPTPTPPPGSPPVNKTWYFGEGRIGGSFNEYLTLGNPDAVHACAVNVQYLYTIDGSKPTSKTLITTIPPNTRATRVVNTDLGIQ